MTVHLTLPSKRELKPRIVVFGIGGAGGNAVNNMIRSGLEGVDFVVANTDAQALAGSAAERRIQMGGKLTEGLGAGSDPEVGRQAAEEAMAEIVDMLQGSHMVFVTAGMGGGTGTGAAPVVARAAHELGILTVGVVTKPFDFEGSRRMNLADAGITELSRSIDTLIIVPNQNLFRVANAHTTFAEAFAMADEVLRSGVSGITDLMIRPGLINLDFADVRTVMSEMGKAMMGTGESQGENRALEAAEAAIANPILDDVSMKGAKGVLINISGGSDMTLYEADEAANRIRQEVDADANIIIGSAFDEGLQGRIRVSVVATGIGLRAPSSDAPASGAAYHAEQGGGAPSGMRAGGGAEGLRRSRAETYGRHAREAPGRSPVVRGRREAVDGGVERTSRSLLDRVLFGGVGKRGTAPPFAPPPLADLDAVMESPPDAGHVVDPSQADGRDDESTDSPRFDMRSSPNRGERPTEAASPVADDREASSPPDSDESPLPAGDRRFDIPTFMRR